MKSSVIILMAFLSVVTSAEPQWARNYHQVTSNVALAGELDSDRLDDLNASGTAVVINLRFPEESRFQEESAVTSAGMVYYNLPIKGGAPDPQTVARFSSIINTHSEQGILVHCASGNRAGVIWAAHLLETGHSLEHALEQVSVVATKRTSISAIHAYASEYTKKQRM